MLKKLALLALVVLSAFSLPVQAFWKSDITMLVVPREVIPLQIAQDLSRRYPVLLVSYQTTVRSGLKLHAWDGDSWVAVPVEDYSSGTFFANRPTHSIIVEYDRVRAPTVLTPNSTWCESATRITSTDPRVILHLLGLYFDFPFSHWDQFAKRYGYEIEEINPTLSNVHWWNLSGDVLAEKRAKRNFSIDLDKWNYLKPLPPAPITPVVLEKDPVIPEIEKPAAEPVAPEKTGTVTTAVNIIADKKPEAPAEKTQAVIPAPEPPAFPSLKPEPVIEPFTATNAAPAVEPVKATELTPEVDPVPAPLIEVPANPATESAAAFKTDPFSVDEIPAAEIVVPKEPKKSWWK